MMSRRRMGIAIAVTALLAGCGGPPPPTPAQQAAAAANPALTGRQALNEGLDGLQITKPPYGVIAGIDLNQNGKLIFSVPHGETPDNVRVISWAFGVPSVVASHTGACAAGPWDR